MSVGHRIPAARTTGASLLLLILIKIFKLLLINNYNAALASAGDIALGKVNYRAY